MLSLPVHFQGIFSCSKQLSSLVDKQFELKYAFYRFLLLRGTYSLAELDY